MYPASLTREGVKVEVARIVNCRPGELVLVVATRAILLRRLGTLLAITVCLLGFAPQPCDLPFPNLWTVFALALFVVCLASAAMFNGEDGNLA